MLLITSPTLTDLSTWYNVVGLGYGFLEFLRCTPDVLVPALTPGTVHVWMYVSYLTWYLAWYWYWYQYQVLGYMYCRWNCGLAAVG